MEALEELVRCESPSGDRDALLACSRVAERLITEAMGAVETREVEEGGVPCLVMRWGEPGGRGPLLLGHLDTVWDKGAFSPLFEASEGRGQGPGVFDMKGGAVVALAALAGLREAGGPNGMLTLLLTGDEEVGSPGSRRLIESEARASSAVFVLEPPVGRAVKIARKGVGGYRITVRGLASHAGLDPDKGVNALVAIAPLVAEIAALGRPEMGTTVSPTVLRAGTRTNVIPALAQLDVDVRFSTANEAARVDSAMRRLQAALSQATLEVDGGINRPPFEPAASTEVFAMAREVALELDWSELEGATVGGGSDGNFTAALGIPTLDGMGIVGGNAHAAGEWAELSSIPDRAALLAGCVSRVWRGELG